MSKSSSFFDDQMLSMKSVEAIIILDASGKRLFAKYYSPRVLKKQTEFEAELFKRTKRVSNEVLLLEEFVIVYKSNIDVFFYVVGAKDENELILLGVLETLFDTLSMLTENQIDKRSLLEQADILFLVMDELVDDGIVLDTDPDRILEHVNFRAVESESSILTEQSISQAFQSAKEQVRAFLR